MIEGFSISLSMTKKIGVKGITCTLLASFLFLSVGPSLVEAQNGTICFYRSPWQCYGASSCCNDNPDNTCCQNFYITWGYAVDVSPPSGESFIYADSICYSIYATSFGYYCVIGQCLRKFASAKWKAITGRNTDGAELGSEKSCNRTVSPDIFRYTFLTEDRRRAHWVLPTKSLAEADLGGPPIDLPDEEQVIWFKSRGATLQEEDYQTTPVPDYNKKSCRLPNPRADPSADPSSPGLHASPGRQ